MNRSKQSARLALTRSSTKQQKRLRILAAAIPSIGLARFAMSASGPDTWTGISAATFNLAGDWSGTNTPPSSGDSLVFTGSSTNGTSLTDDRFTPGAFTIASITFNNNALGYTINPQTPGTNGFTLSGAITNYSPNTQTINDLITLSGNDTINATSGNIAVGGNISGTNFGLIKIGNATLTLSGSESYTGNTTVSAGTLLLTGSLSSPGLVVGGGAFSYAPTVGGSTQSFASGTSVAGGGSTINSASGDTVSLGAISRSTGGTVDFNSTTTGTITTSNTNDATGILGAWATTESGTSLAYAMNNGSSIVAYSGGTAGTAGNLSNVTSGTTNYTFAGNATQTGNVNANTLQYTGGTGTLANGGFTTTLNGLMNAGTGALTISGTGKLMSGSSKELVITGNTQNITISSVIADSTSGSSNLTYSGLGTLALSTGNTISGSTYLNGGITTIGADSALGDSGAVISVTTSSTSSTAVALTSATLPAGFGVGSNLLGQKVTTISGTSVTLSGNANGTISTPTNEAFVNPLTLTNATLQFTTAFSLAETTGNGTNRWVTLVGNDGITLTNATGSTIAGVISGSGSLTLSTGGTSNSTSISGVNTFNGGLTINGNGRVQVDGNPNAALGTGPVTLNNTGFGGNGNIYWHNQNPSAVTNNFNIVGSSNEIDISSGNNQTYTYSGSFFGGGNLTWNFGFSNSGAKFTGDLTQFAGTMTQSGAAYLQFANTTAIGLPNGTLALTAGGVTWGGGTTATIPLGALSSSVVTDGVADGGTSNVTWQVGGLGTSATFAGNLMNQNGAGVSSLLKVGAGTLTVSGYDAYTGGTTISAGTITINSSPIAAVTTTGNASQSTNLTVASTTGITVGQAVNGTNIENGAVVTAIGSGNVTLNLATTGTINAGTTISFLAGGPLGNPSNPLTVGQAASSSATLDLNSTSTQVGSLSGSSVGNITSSTNTGTPILTVSGGSSTTYAGVITNGGSTTNGVGLKVGGNGTAGALDLTGNSTYTGATAIVSGGTLQVGGGTGNIGGAAGTALTLGDGTAGNATLVLGDANGVGNAIVSSLATGGNVSATYSIIGGNASNSTLVVNYTNTNAPNIYGGAIGNATGNGNNLGLVKTGPGTLNLTAVSTYIGPTVISAGTLKVSGALGNTPTTIISGATLTGSGASSTTGVIGGNVTANGNGTITLTSGNSSQALVVGNLTLGASGAMYGSGNYSNLSWTLSGSQAEALDLGAFGNANGTLTVNSGGGYISVIGTASSGVTYILANYGSASGLTNLSLNAATGNVTTMNVGRQTYTLNENTENLTLSVTGAQVPVAAYYDGAVSTVWNDLGNNSFVNWSTTSDGQTDGGNVPGAVSDVFLNASATNATAGSPQAVNVTGSVTTTLGGNTTINSLTFTGTGTNTIGADGSILTINGSTAGSSFYSAGTGIVVNSGANASSINVPVNIAASQSWTNNSSSTLNVAGNVTGTAGVSSTQILTLANTGSGNTTISGVVVDGTGGGNLAMLINSSGTGNVILSDSNGFTGGTRVSAGTLQFASGGSLLSSGALTVNGGVVDINGTNQTIGSLSGSGGTILNNGGSTNTLTVGSGNTGGGTYAGVIANNNNAGTGVLNLTKIGTGIIGLSNANTYTGATAISGGALNISNANALGNSSGVTVASGAALQLSGGITPNIAALTLNGQGVSASTNGALESVSGANGYSSAIALGSAAAIGVDAGTFNVSGTISGNVALTLNGSGGTGNVSSVLGSTSISSLTKSGASTWVVSSLNSYTGGTTIIAGTLQPGIATSGSTGPFGGPTTAMTIAGGTLDLNGYNITKGVVSTTGGTITNNGAPATFTVGNGNAAVNLTGLTSVSGNLTVLVTGTGAWTGNPTFTSTVTSAGGITFQNDNGTEVANNIATNLGSNGTLTFNGNANVTTGYASGPTVTTAAGNAIVVNGTGNSWQWQTTVTTNGAWTGNGTIFLQQGFTPTFTFAGNMTGFAGTLQLNTSGTTGNNNATYALSDTSAVGGASAIWNQQAVANNVGVSTLEWSGAGSQTIPLGDLNTAGNLGNGAIRLINATASTIATWQVGALGLSSTYSGTIADGTGISALNKVGTGAWTLTGNNSYSGGTTISAGTLFANNATSSLGTGTVNINGGTLAGSGKISNGSNTLTVNNGGTIAAGSTATAAGTLTTTGSQTWNSGGTYAWKITGSNQGAGTAGVPVGSGASGTLAGGTGVEGSDWDQLVMSGLSVPSTTTSPFTIALTANNPSGQTVGEYSWVIAQTGSSSLPNGNITASDNLLSQGSNAADAGMFALNTTNFTFDGVNAPSQSLFSLEFVTVNGGSNYDLVLDYNAAPEPGTAILLLAGSFPVLTARRRRRAAAFETSKS